MSLRTGLIDLRPLAASAAYRRLWAGTALSGLGHQMMVVAVLFQVWELTKSPVWTGMIGLASALPMIVFGTVGGTLADAVDRRVLVRWTTLGQMLTAAALAAQAATRMHHLALILALVAVQSACSALGSPARRTLPARLLPRDLVPAGLALQHLNFQGAMLAGPALAGLIIGQWGLTACYAIEAVALLASLYAVVRLPALPPLGSEPHRPGLRSIADGLRHIVRSPAVSGSFATDLFATLLAMPIALFPVINELRFGGAPETLGLFPAAIAVGGILAGLGSGLISRADRIGRVQLGAAVAWGLALAAFGLAEPLWAVLGALAIAGAADTIAVIARGTLVQLATPDSHRGRVSSAELVIGLAGPDLGNARAGVVASLTSGPFALASGGLLCVAGVLWVALRNRPLREFRVSTSAETEARELV
ncbi:MFS transporter [Glycomyces algeriensis]|uniref:MFS transporter n=1 Tax=Glycomyces algeriensis TaxID=256037 RepID=A0A9W6LHJ7_9ACTN|nr:MFS transporter [Glycomyces algeriensis]MDA1368984.1 MFS transporter [Glycomyces algeriensis]MDR7350172.1 MFS family permease [Glycomyces algeriensis]GLI42884.1 MFS transporter [Glycomyces algeriensis]